MWEMIQLMANSTQYIRIKSTFIVINMFNIYLFNRDFVQYMMNVTIYMWLARTNEQ